MTMLIDGMYIAEWKNTDQNVERKLSGCLS